MLCDATVSEEEEHVHKSAVVCWGKIHNQKGKIGLNNILLAIYDSYNIYQEQSNM